MVNVVADNAKLRGRAARHRRRRRRARRGGRGRAALEATGGAVKAAILVAAGARGRDRRPTGGSPPSGGHLGPALGAPSAPAASEAGRETGPQRGTQQQGETHAPQTADRPAARLDAPWPAPPPSPRTPRSPSRAGATTTCRSGRRRSSRPSRPSNPGIKVIFSPSAPTEYNAALNAKLDAGSAGDLITCRPFDQSLELFNKGKLADLTDLPGMDELLRRRQGRPGRPTTARRPSACRWPRSSTASSTTRTPSTSSASAVPATEAEFFAALDKIKADGTYIPMAMGTKDQWEAATMGYQNIGPNYWKGEEGRLALIKGEQKLTDAALGRALRDARQVEALSRRRLRGADLSRQPEPVHARPRRDLSGRLLGDRAASTRRAAVQDGRLPAAGAEGRRHLLHLRPHRHRASA